MRVLVTGGTGFVGHPMLTLLVEQGHEVRALVRDPRGFNVAGVQPLQGDVLEPATLLSAAAGCEACIHLVGILREFPEGGITFDRLHYQATRNVVEACRQNEVRRFVQMSANGAERGIATGYFLSKARAEVAVQASGLEWVIMRPSVIYGGKPDRPNFVGMIEKQLKWSPAFPYFPGRCAVAPVSAREVGLAFAKALVHPEAPGHAYHLCGGERYTFKELVTLIRDLGGYKSMLFPLPFFAAELPASLLGRYRWFPLTVEMLRMLKEGNCCPPAAPDFHGQLDVPVETFEQWLLAGRRGRERQLPPPAAPLDQGKPTRHLNAPPEN